MFRVIIVIIVLTSINFSQQIDNSKNESLRKGKEIIRKSKETLGISLSMTSFIVKLRSVRNLENQENSSNDSQIEIAIFPLEKIRILSISEDGNVISRSIWNEKKFKQTLESESEGRRYVYDTTNGTPLSQTALNAIKSKKSEVKVENPRSVAFSDSLWKLVFPFILRHPIDSSEKIEYLGRAQAGERIASFVQLTTANGRTIQMFFDEKTNYLLLMIEKFKKSEREYENKYYFSNREERSGVLVPTKFKIEHKVTLKGESPITFFEYIELESFEANPKIDNKIFEIK